MIDPLRLRILQGLTAALEEITPANGYDDSLAGAVFRGRPYYGSEAPLPMVAIIEPPVAEDALFGTDGSSFNVTDWPLILQGFVRDDIKNPTDPAYRLEAQVRRRLAIEKGRRGTGANSRGANVLDFGSLITKFEIGNPIVRPSDDISTVAYFWLPLRIGLAEDLSAA